MTQETNNAIVVAFITSTKSFEGGICDGLKSKMVLKGEVPEEGCSLF